MNGQSNGCDNVIVPEEIRIPVPWGHISGKWWGSRDRQPILAIHGWQDNAGTFDPLAELLAKDGHSIFCIDLPGHGFSSPFADGHYYYLFWDGIHIVRRIVKHFKWSNISIIGHSLGGGIGFLYAASYPNDVDKYLSLDIASPSVRDLKTMVDNIPQAVDRFFKYEHLTPEMQPCYGREEMLDIVYEGYTGGLTRQSCQIMMRRGMKAAGGGKYLFTRDPRLKVAALGFFTPDQVMEFASRITCEVANIRAVPGSKFYYPEFYDKVLDAIEVQAKKMERHLVDGTHHVHLNDPERIHKIVNRFLRG